MDVFTLKVGNIYILEWDDIIFESSNVNLGYRQTKILRNTTFILLKIEKPQYYARYKILTQQGIIGWIQLAFKPKEFLKEK